MFKKSDEKADSKDMKNGNEKYNFQNMWMFKKTAKNLQLYL